MYLSSILCFTGYISDMYLANKYTPKELMLIKTQDINYQLEKVQRIEVKANKKFINLWVDYVVPNC